MPKQKRDYKALKKEFMASKHLGVKSFFEEKFGECNRNWNMSKNTKWWTKEKKELKAKSADKALKQVETKLAKQLEPSTEFLLWNIAKAIELTQVKLEQMEKKGNINVKDLNTIRSMNRIQNWQPNTYVKEEQDVNQTVRIEWIHIVMWWNMWDWSQTSQNQAKSNE